MGIQGLTTHLRKNQSKAATLENLSALAKTRKQETGQPLYLAVDGSAFHFIISDLVSTHLRREFRENKVLLPFVYGGQYQALSDAVCSFVSTFRSHDIELMFFFDSLSTPDQDAFKAVERARRREDSDSALTMLYEILATGRLSSSTLELADVLPTATRRQVQMTLAELNVFMMRVPGEADHAIAYLLGVRHQLLKRSKKKEALENLVPGLPYAVLGRDSDFAVLPGCRYIDLNDCLYLPNNPVLIGDGTHARMAKYVVNALTKGSSVTQGVLPAMEVKIKENSSGGEDESKCEDAVVTEFEELSLGGPPTPKPLSSDLANPLDTFALERKHKDASEGSGDDEASVEGTDKLLDEHVAELSVLEAFKPHSDHIWAMVYTPERVAASLGIDVHLLPQFAAFAGCDYTKVILQETNLRTTLRIDTDMGNVAATAEWMRNWLSSTEGAPLQLWKQKKVKKALRQCDKDYKASKDTPWLNVAAAHGLPDTAGKLFLHAIGYCRELYTLGVSVTKPYRSVIHTFTERLTASYKNIFPAEELRLPRMRKMAWDLLHCDHDEWEYRGRFVTERCAAVVGFETPPPSIPAYGPPTLLASLEQRLSPHFPVLLEHISRSFSLRPSTFEVLRPLRALRAGFYSTTEVTEYFNFPNRSARPFPGAPVLAAGIVVPAVEPPSAVRTGVTAFSTWCNDVVTTLCTQWHPAWSHRMPFIIPLKGNPGKATSKEEQQRGTGRVEAARSSLGKETKEKESGSLDAAREAGNDTILLLGSTTLPWFEGEAINFQLSNREEFSGASFDRLRSSVQKAFPLQGEAILVGVSLVRYLLAVQACQSAAAWVPPPAFPPKGASSVSAPCTVPSKPLLSTKAVGALLAQLLVSAHLGNLDNPVLGLREFLAGASLPLPNMQVCNVSAAYLAAFKELLNLHRLRTNAPPMLSVQPKNIFDGFLYQYFLTMSHVTDVEEKLKPLGLYPVFSELFRSLLFAFKISIAGKPLTPKQQVMLTFYGALTVESKVDGKQLFESISAQLRQQEEQATAETDVDEEITEFSERKTTDVGLSTIPDEAPESETRIDMAALAKSVRFPERNFISPQEFKVLSKAQRTRLTRNATSEFPSRGKTPLLPIHEHAETILYELHTRAILLITADTGSGKSTQVPQFILRCHRREQRIRQSEHDKRMSKLPQAARVPLPRRGAPRILVSQPRRVAAIRLAERVAHELGTSVGAGVGYRIGQDARVSKATNITFCTAGWLRTWLLHNLDDLSTYSHIVLDEVCQLCFPMFIRQQAFVPLAYLRCMSEALMWTWCA